MVTHTLVINDSKTGKSYQKVLETEAFLGKKIGDVVPGEYAGLEGYELQIRGGSDIAGFPLRKDVEGTGRKRGLFSYSVGMRERGSGLRRRKTVCGNTITATTVQVNLRIANYGKDPVDALLAPSEAPAGEVSS